MRTIQKGNDSEVFASGTDDEQHKHKVNRALIETQHYPETSSQ